MSGTQTPKKEKKAIGGALSLATRVYMLAAFFFSVVIYCDRLMANIDFALRTLAQAGWIFRRCCTGKSPHPLDRSSVVWHATSPIPNGKIGFHKPYINTKDIYLGDEVGSSTVIWFGLFRTMTRQQTFYIRYLIMFQTDSCWTLKSPTIARVLFYHDRNSWIHLVIWLWRLVLPFANASIITNT